MDWSKENQCQLPIEDLTKRCKAWEPLVGLDFPFHDNSGGNGDDDDMTRLLLFQKVESNEGPFFKLVLEC